MPDQEEEVGKGGERKLPPISHVVEPEMRYISTRIRWWVGLGYSHAEVANFLGVRYQMVRNVMTTVPKRAIREDVPPLEIQLYELDDDLEAMDRQAFLQQVTAMRSESAAERRATRRGRREMLSDNEDDDGDDDE